MTFRELKDIIARHETIINANTATLASHTAILHDLAANMQVLLKKHNESSSSRGTPSSSSGLHLASKLSTSPSSLPAAAHANAPPSVTNQLPPPHQVASATPTPAISLPPRSPSPSPTQVITTVAESPFKHTSVVTAIMDNESLPSFGIFSYVSVDIQGYQFTTSTALVFDFMPEVPVHSNCMTWTLARIFEERERPEDTPAIRIWLVLWEEEQLRPKGTVAIRIWLVPWINFPHRLEDKPVFEGAGMMGTQPSPNLPCKFSC